MIQPPNNDFAKVSETVDLNGNPRIRPDIDDDAPLPRHFTLDMPDDEFAHRAEALYASYVQAKAQIRVCAEPEFTRLTDASQTAYKAWKDFTTPRDLARIFGDAEELSRREEGQILSDSEYQRDKWREQKARHSEKKRQYRD